MNMSNLHEHEISSGTAIKKYSFYTYAKEKQTSDPLEVVFSGDIVKKNILKKTAVSAKWFAFADIYTPKIWGSTGNKAFTLNTGWEGKPTVFLL